MNKQYLKFKIIGLGLVWLIALPFSLLFAQGGDMVIQKVKDGLSQNTVVCMVQDELGFMWFGTRYGLNSFDGINYTSYPYDLHEDSSRGDESIESLMADGNGNIWVGTYGDGVSLFNVYTKKYSKPDIKLNQAGRYINKLYRGSNGKIWIGSFDKGLSYFDPASGYFYNFIEGNENGQFINDKDVGEICEDGYGNIWVGTWGGGLKLIRKGSGVPGESDFLPPETFMDGELIRSLHKGKSNRVWVGPTTGIYEIINFGNDIQINSIGANEGLIADKLNSSRVISILEFQNRLWIGSENVGLFVMNQLSSELEVYTKDDIVLDEKSGINGNSVWELYADKFGTVWISTWLGGLNKVDLFQQKFSSVKNAYVDERTTDLRLVSSLAEDNKGNVWVGSDGGGLWYFDKNKNRFSKHFDKTHSGGLSGDVIVSLLYDKDENLWVGTWHHGVNILRKGADQFEKIICAQPDELKSVGNSIGIQTIFQDSKGLIWIAINDFGLDCYNPETGKFKYFRKCESGNCINSSIIRTIGEDANGDLWIGTEANGIQRLRFDEELNIIEAEEYLNKNFDQKGRGQRINSIYKDDKDKLWLSSSGEGLFEYMPAQDSFIQYTVEDGLSSNLVFSVINDDFGNLWGSTNKGLFCMNPKDKSVKIFTEEDGLQSDEFFRKSYLKSSTGELYFGGLNGFNYFDPKNVLTKKNNVTPEVYITSISISEKDKSPNSVKKQERILNNETIELAHWQNDLSIDFTAINFIQSEKNQFLFKLENYDNNWRKVEGGLTATYTNIPPGRYKFKVAASNNEGIWNMKGAEVELCISKPWYATAWAYFVYASILLGALLWARNNLIVRERLKVQMKMDKMELGKMQELDKMKSQFFANISHEFKTPLTLIMTPVRALMNVNPNSGNFNHFKTILNNSERLLKLVNQIMDVSRMESGKLDIKVAEYDMVGFVKSIAVNFSEYADYNMIEYEMVFPDAEIPVLFEKEKMEKVFVNLLSNAFKYTKIYGKVRIGVTEKEDTVEVFVEDNGKGINPEEQQFIFNRFYKSDHHDDSLSSGLGLSIARHLVQLHKGEILLSSKVGLGSQFVISLKKGRGHFEKQQIDEENKEFKFSPESLIALNSFQQSKSGDEEGELKRKQKPVVLLVEDNVELRRMTVSILRDKYEILEAKDGWQGYQMAKEYLPDVVITDVVMPKMNGYELSNKLKSDVLTSHIFVVMLTVKSSESSVAEGLQKGVDHYLTKPFNPALLDLLIQNMLKSRQGFKKWLLNKEPVNLPPNRKPAVRSEVEETFLNELIAVVDENLRNPDFKIEHLCRAAGMSKSQLYRKLKSIVGQSGNEFIRSIRLKRAAQLLKQGDLKVSEVTYQVGFNDLHYFRDCFKKQYGMSPTSFARHAKESD